jgi:hypothetical protein
LLQARSHRLVATHDHWMLHVGCTAAARRWRCRSQPDCWSLQMNSGDYAVIGALVAAGAAVVALFITAIAARAARDKPRFRSGFVRMLLSRTYGRTCGLRTSTVSS